MTEQKHIVIFSHGFGVKKDGRGLFTDIAVALPGVESIMFDYNEVDEAKSQITVRSFSDQTALLQKEIESAQKANPQAIVDIVGHSQGCMTAALANFSGIRKVVLLAPPFDSDIQKRIDRFKVRPGSEINLDGMSKIVRRDGSVTLIPPEYWSGRGSINAAELYNKLAAKVSVVVVNANQDDVIDPAEASEVLGAKTINIDGDHNFTGDARRGLLEVLKQNLLQ